jgi:tetratricopeptide (TPR) repeat protein
MMNHWILIDDYLLGKLSDEKRKAFERELAINQSLRKEVKLCAELNKSIYEDDVIALREKLKISQRSLSQAKSLNKTLIISAISAASLLIIFALRIVLVDYNPTHTELYHKHFQPYRVAGDRRGVNQGHSAYHYGEIVKLYTNGEYAQVTPWLEAQIKRDSMDLETGLMLSTVYLETNNAEKAEEILTKMLHSTYSITFDETLEWYLALAVLRQGKIDEVKKILMKIVHEDGFYSGEALAILESLKL